MVSAVRPTSCAAGWKMRSRQLSQPSPDQAPDQLVLCRPAAADAELGEVAGERCEQFGVTWLDPAALRRAIVDRALT